MFARISSPAKINPYINYTAYDIENKLLSEYDDWDTKKLFIEELMKSVELSSKLNEAMNNITSSLNLAKLEVMSHEIKVAQTQSALFASINTLKPSMAAIRASNTLHAYLNYESQSKTSDLFNALEKDIFEIVGEKSIKEYQIILSECELLKNKIKHLTKICQEVESIIEKKRLESRDTHRCVIT